MTTRNTLRLSGLLLVVCLISTVMLSGTFAKYTSEYAGQDTALVARWSFTAKGGDGDVTMGAVADNTELKLFDHLYDTNINPNKDADTFIIAPGVGDEFTIKVDYLADVDADVLVAFETLAGSANVPIEYSVDGGENWVTLNDLAEAVAARIGAGGGSVSDPTPGDSTFRIARVAADSADDVNISQTIKWQWRYAKGEAGSAYAAQTDADDTTLGVASSAAGLDRISYGIKVTLKATQVGPATE